MSINKQAREGLIEKIKVLTSSIYSLLEVEALSDKLKNNYLNWLIQKTILLQNERLFKPNTLPHFKRGELVLIDLGFNVGEEYGGKHYAIVIRDSSINHKKILALPITSQEPKNKDLPIYVEIGTIVGLAKNKYHWANILNIANLSKQRIIVTLNTPLRVNDRVLNRISGAAISQIALRNRE